MNDLINFVRMSKYAGQRFDMVQAGGGNTSVKLDDGTMLIKASGVSLSEVNQSSGYVELELAAVASILNDCELLSHVDQKKREVWVNSKLADVVKMNSLRPSIELFMHILLQKYVLHVHPVAVTMVVCQRKWNEIAEELFPEALCVEYQTPGIDLALAIKEKINQYRGYHEIVPQIIFLQNHGLIVHAETVAEVLDVVEDVLTRLETFLCVNFDTYKLSTKIIDLMNSCCINNDFIAYVSQDAWLKQALIDNKTMFFSLPCCPDTLVYCGIMPVEIQSFSDEQPILSYVQKYMMPPRVVIYLNNIVFFVPTVRKAVECEAVFKAHLMMIKQLKNNCQALGLQDLLYLTNMESEKYRQLS